MPLFVAIAVDPQAQLPAGSRIRLIATGIFEQPFLLSSPGSFENWSYTLPLPASFAAEVEVFVGDRPPIVVGAQIPTDDSRVSFMVLPGTPNNPKFLFAGNVDHAVHRAAAPCQVVCLTDGKTAGPGACVECENEAAIVKLCC